MMIGNGLLLHLALFSAYDGFGELYGFDAVGGVGIGAAGVGVVLGDGGTANHDFGAGSGFVELVGEENFCANISDALKHAEALISR